MVSAPTPPPAQSAPSPTVLLFDGECDFCNGSVRFVLERDAAQRFQFASLQSAAGQRLLQRFGLGLDLDTMVLVDGDQAYTRSDAVLRVMKNLGPLFRLLGSFGQLLPRAVRDLGYSLFARHRYAWFGRTEQCLIPSPELRARFLAD